MKDMDAVKLFKCLGDLSRLNIVSSLLKEDMYVELLAQRLGLTSATVSFHLKKLEEAGAVSSRRDQYYVMYTLNRAMLSKNIIELIGEVADDSDAQKREAQYREKVLSTFFVYGKLVSIPAQRKKKRICLERIAQDFTIGKTYDEADVNEIILKYHEDYCTIRRDMISEKLFIRDGSKYTRI